MKNKLLMLLVFAFTFGVAAAAEAHITIASGPGFANKSGIVQFSIGHGCAGSDTFAITVDIPAGVTSVRPMNSDFSQTSFTVDANNVVNTVTWQKSVADAYPADTNYYLLAVRAKMPNTPFITQYWKFHQTCRAADSTLVYDDWAALPGEMGNPAAAQNILPVRLPGWNKFTVPADIADASVFFQDALIVWKGTGAYSFNANTTALISTTMGVSLLPVDALKANDEIWVRY